MGDNLPGQMARQVLLKGNEFLDLIDCPLSREDLDRRITEKDNGDGY